MKIFNFLRSSGFLTGLLTTLVLGVFSASTTYAVTLYKWVDAEGNISYQDTPPPAGQKYEERSFSLEGARTGDRNAEIARSEATRENPVTLYRADNCESCDVVETILNSNNVPFSVIQADTDTEAQKKLNELIGSIRVPTLTIGTNVINGTNRAAIEDSLEAAGYPEPEDQSGNLQ